MRTALSLVLIVLLVAAGCASTEPAKKKKHRVVRKPAARERTVEPSSPPQAPPAKNAAPERREPSGSDAASALRREERMLLPTVVNLPDRSVLVLVAGGKHLIGGLDLPKGRISGESSASRFEFLDSFYMDLTEIRVDQFKAFDPEYDEKPFTGGKECPRCPAMGINWETATRYCASMGKRLPTEAEWEAAARSASNFVFPWGNTFSGDRANLQGGDDGFAGVAPVGSFPLGASPFGVLDLAGNVWEWVSTPHTPVPLRPGAGEKQFLQVIKGGGWSSGPDMARISHRQIVEPGLKNPTFGFRCVKTAE